MLGVILVSAALGILVFIMAGGTKEKVIDTGNTGIESVKAIVEKVKLFAKGVIAKLKK